MFREDEHPRDKSGKFTDKGAGEAEKLRKSTSRQRLEHLGRTFAEKLINSIKL